MELRGVGPGIGVVGLGVIDDDLGVGKIRVLGGEDSESQREQKTGGVRLPVVGARREEADGVNDARGAQVYGDPFEGGGDAATWL